MTQRECAASGEAEVALRPAGECHAPAHLEKASGTRIHPVPVWEHLYRAISPEQQRELLALAERQGILYAHQLPVISNGSAVEPTRKLLTQLLSGAIAELPPLYAEPVEVGDHELDAVQREAVAKAL